MMISLSLPKDSEHSFNALMLYYLIAFNSTLPTFFNQITITKRDKPLMRFVPLTIINNEKEFIFFINRQMS